MNQDHIPVLLQEIVDALDIRPGKKYIDATVGLGGHTIEIAKHGGRVLGIDRDPETIKKLTLSLIQEYSDLVHLNQGNFKDIKSIAQTNGFSQVHGIIFDLGFSSWQLDKGSRGFSFTKDEPLDLRFDAVQTKHTAADFLNEYSKKELENIFARYGELEQAEQIADVIVKNRPVWKTSTLNKIIAENITSHMPERLLARIYQALRICVNEELVHIEIAIADSIELLEKEGRICVISFHSLEDRIVKLALRDSRLHILTKKPIVAKNEEIQRNSRSRSAKLRIAKKI